MEPTISRVFMLLCFPVCLLCMPAAQDDPRPATGPKPEHPILFPGHDAFYAIIGLKNNTGASVNNPPPVRPITSTTYRPQISNVFPPAASVPMELSETKPFQDIQPNDCKESSNWENVTPFEQEIKNDKQVNTQLAVEALFKISNRMEKLITDKNVNIVISPLGLVSVLGQLMLAARANTLLELENFLAPGKSLCRDGAANKFHYSFRSLVSQLWRRRGSIAYELSSRNALFYQSPGQALNTGFTKRLSQEYATEIFPSDYRNNPELSLKQINEWGSTASRGKINQLVPEMPSRSTSAILSSVTYFKASWENVFNKQFTGPGPFYLDGDRNGRVKTINFMVAEMEIPYAESTSLGCRIMSMPYINNETSLYIIMPLGPPKRKRPPSSSQSSSTPSPALPPRIAEDADIPLVGRIQEVQPLPAKEKTPYVMPVAPSYFSFFQLRQQAPFYTRDMIVYPQSYESSFQQNINNQAARRMKRQSTPTEPDRPCSNTVDGSSLPTARPCPPSTLSASNLHDIASRLGPAEFSRLISTMRSRKVSVIIPKLSMSTNVKLKDALSSLGIPSAFGEGANFSGAVEENNDESSGSERRDGSSNRNVNWWKVDEVWQQSTLDVDEYGTEATSGTAIGIVDYGGDSVVFKVNSPFLAIVRHEETGAPLFWASIVNPS